MPVVDASSTLDLMTYLGDRAPSSLQGGFGRITDQQQLVISQAAQQGVLTIDEDGTLAAAVTEMGMAGSAPVEPPFELIVDRPYLVASRTSGPGGRSSSLTWRTPAARNEKAVPEGRHRRGTPSTPASNRQPADPRRRQLRPVGRLNLSSYPRARAGSAGEMTHLSHLWRTRSAELGLPACQCRGGQFVWGFVSG
jgi:hypothetical protein